MEFNPKRYDSMVYRRCGRSGLLLPAISLGAWETFGGYRGAEVARECLFGTFDLGITHFDLANNYGTPPGNAEIVCGKVIKEMPRDELIISSKAGYRMWPGPYGEWGSKKYIVASCDQSLARMGLEYFDIFYSHRPDPDTPLEETLGALNLLVRQGKALYAGVSNYSGAQYASGVRIAAEHDWAPITIHQPYYHMLSRGVESDLLGQTAAAGTGVIAYCPLASGMLSDKYLQGIPADSRAAQKWGKGWVEQNLTPQRKQTLVELNELAKKRGQTLAQMALAWLLRLPAVTSALIGASSLKQVQENVGALAKLEFSADELAKIDALTRLGGDMVHLMLAETAWEGAKTRLDQLIHGFFTSIPDIVLGVFVFAGVLIVGRIMRTAVQRFAQERQKRKNVAIVLGRLTEGMFFVLAILVAAAIMFPQFNAGSLISLLGIGSVAIGFAFREVLQNYLAGILLLLTEPFRIGDQVVLGAFEGIVKDIQTRATLLKTSDGRRVVVPNAELFTGSLVVNTAFKLRRLEYDVQLTYGQDIAAARQVIVSAVVQCESVLKSPEPEVLIWDVNGSTVILRTRWWVMTEDSVDATLARDRVVRPLAGALAKQGIEWSSPVQQVVLQAPQVPVKKRADDEF